MAELEEFMAEVEPKLLRKMNREVLKYAVMRKMFNDCCGSIADVRRSILIEVGVPEKGSGFKLYCGECVGDVGAAVERIYELLPTAKVEVYDGRELSKR